MLQCPMRGNNMITPARATVMADLKKVRHIVLSRKTRFFFFDSWLFLSFLNATNGRNEIAVTYESVGKTLF